MKIEVNAKRAIVAGGAGAIGSAIVRALADAGSTVTVFDIDRDAFTDRPDIACEDVDLVSVPAMRAAVDEAASGGGLDILVHAAGINPQKAAAEITEEEWDRVQAVNLKSCFFLAQAAQPHMRARGGGSIVLVSSCSAKLGYPGLAAYSASKGGVEGLVRNLACDLAPDNIRVNAIAPGTTITPMTRGLWEDPAKRAAHEATIPLKRLATVDDCARAVLFLACDASAYITGAVLPVDGGLTAMQQDFIDLDMRGW